MPPDLHHWDKPTKFGPPRNFWLATPLRWTHGSVSHVSTVSSLCSSDQMAEWYRASVSRAVDSGLIPSRVKPMTLKKNWYSQLPCLTLSIKGTVWRTSRQVYLLYRWERHLAGFPHHGVVDRWLATPKRARIAHWSLSRDRRINMQLTN